LLHEVQKFEVLFINSNSVSIRFVTVTQEHAYSKPRSRIVSINSAWLHLLHRQPAQLNVVT